MAEEKRGVTSAHAPWVWIMNTVCEMKEGRTCLAVQLQGAARACRGDNDWNGGKRTAGARTVN